MTSKGNKYKKVMETTGFYHNGKPISTLIEAKDLREGTQTNLDKVVKYNSIISSDEFKISSIYELSGSPCVLFSELDHPNPSAAELSRVRRAAWNQGLAPLLWVITPEKVIVYNCYSKPRRDDDTNPDRHLISVFEQTEAGLRELNSLAGRLQIESGEFWRSDEAEKIDRSQRVDESLLKDLEWAERKLIKAGLLSDVAHALLGRSIFVAYLQDRGILTPSFFRREFNAGSFVEVLRSKTATYALFRWIRRTFNGSLFPLTRKIRSTNGSRTLREQDVVEPSHLKILRDLMAGTEMRSGQGRLWPYDFRIIPVELISSIYEKFSYSADPQEARSRSTYYTPYNLVNLVLTHVLNEPPENAKILDSACGSGVFLVESLRRLVAYRTLQGEKRTRKLVRDILHNQIFGIDVSKEAVQLAAFSLYLTAIELDPNPQPPSALKFKPLIGSNLFAADAFNEEAEFNYREPFESRSFAAIVGNPPWKSGKKAYNRRLIQYCKDRNYPLARNTADQAFMWRAGDFANENTRIGLIMHGKPFFGHTESALRAKNGLLTKFKPSVIFNLADLRGDRLFPRSEAPALIIIGECKQAAPGESFVFVTPKRTEAFKRHGILEISTEDIKRLSIQLAAKDIDLLKVASWAGARDFELIRSLRSSFPSLKDVIKNCNCRAGQGFQTAGGSTEAPELSELKYLPPSEMPRYEIDTGVLKKLGMMGLHRPRDKRIYKKPVLVTTRGLSRRGFASAYSKNDVVYSESYYGISFADTPKEKTHFTHYLNGILNSSLTTYFLFLTSTVWGVERDEVRKEDLLRLPVPTEDEESISKVIELEGQLRSARTEGEQNRLQNRLNGLVYDLYGLDESERVLVEDAVEYTVGLRMRGEASGALARPSVPQLRSYSAHVIDVIAPYLESQGGQGLSVRVPDVGAAPLAVVEFTEGRVQKQEAKFQVVPEQNLDAILEKIAGQLPHEVAENVYTQRVLRIYAGKDLYVVKPAQRRYWSRSAGLSDGDAILAEHLEDESLEYTEEHVERRQAEITETGYAT
jgi:hypothetical protein